jgi:fatty-acyl-CoA synthase
VQTPLLLELTADVSGDRKALGALADGLDFAAMRGNARAAAAWLAESGAQNAVFVGLNGNALPILMFASGMAVLRAGKLPLVRCRASQTDRTDRAVAGGG